MRSNIVSPFHLNRDFTLRRGDHQPVRTVAKTLVLTLFVVVVYLTPRPPLHARRGGETLPGSPLSVFGEGI
jgi:hypothetical protein